MHKTARCSAQGRQLCPWDGKQKDGMAADSPTLPRERLLLPFSLDGHLQAANCSLHYLTNGCSMGSWALLLIGQEETTVSRARFRKKFFAGQRLELGAQGNGGILGTSLEVPNTCVSVELRDMV